MKTMKRGKVFSFILIAFSVADLWASDAELPYASATGRLTGAYQDNVDAAFVCLVLESGGNFQYAFMKTNDTASVLKDLQGFVGRNVFVKGYAENP